MKIIKFLSGIILPYMVIVLLCTACKKDEPNLPELKGAIEFLINQSSIKTKLSMKSHSLSDVRSAMITIQTIEGEATLYTSKLLSIRNMNGNLYLQRAALNPGNYILTGFLLLDEQGNAIYATPIDDSELSVYAADHIPIPFSVSLDSVTSVNIQVLSTENRIPEQFGMVSFLVAEIPTFKFAIRVVDAVSDEIIPATLILSSGTYTFDKELDSTLINQVTVRDGFLNYSLTIAKAGYISTIQIYSVDSLKAFIDTVVNPLIIELVQLPTTVTDIDGNIYPTAIIGTQVWMAENLKTTRLNDGIEVSLVTSDAEWSSLVTPRYCYYNNDSMMYANTYGALYNWSTVSTDKLCPVGWHVPSKDEWDILFAYLGPAVAADKLRESGTTHWTTHNPEATNESGFTALPGGLRSGSGFYNIGANGTWWSTTEDEFFVNWVFAPSHMGTYIYFDSQPSTNGYSVRCVKK